MTTPGATYASAAKTATWTSVTGTPDANYPVANLSDLVNVSKVSRVVPAAAAAAMVFDLSAAAAVQFVGLVRHNFIAAETVRIRLYAGAGQTGTVLLDTGVIAVWPSGAPVSGYSPSRPYVLGAPVTALSGRLDFAGLTATLELGGVEIAQWMPWTISPGVDFGFSTRAADVALVGGAAEAGDTFIPRIVNGQVDLLSMATTGVQGLDFQKFNGKAGPFIFVQDYDDPTTWSRFCFLARNADLPAMVGALYRHDRFQIRITEHWR